MEPVERPRHGCSRLPSVRMYNSERQCGRVQFSAQHDELTDSRYVQCKYYDWLLRPIHLGHLRECQRGLRKLQRRLRVREDGGLAWVDSPVQFHLVKGSRHGGSGTVLERTERPGPLQSQRDVWSAGI